MPKQREFFTHLRNPRSSPVRKEPRRRTLPRTQQTAGPMDQADFGPTTQQLVPAGASKAPPAGTNLGGFRVVDVLGRGSASIVYLALDSSLQRQVAIKEYLPADLAARR